MEIAIAVAITLVVTAVAVWFISDAYHKKSANSKIGSEDC